MTLQLVTACAVTCGVGFLMIVRGLHEQMLEPRRHRFCAACGRRLERPVCDCSRKDAAG